MNTPHFLLVILFALLYDAVCTAQIIPAITCSTPASSCPVGTFKLRDKQSVLDAVCECVPCPVGTSRFNTSMEVCQMSANAFEYIPNATVPAITRSPGFCTYFLASEAEIALVNTLIEDDANVQRGGNLGVQVSLRSVFKDYESMEKFGGMITTRREQATCANVSMVGSSTNVVNFSIEAAPPNLAYLSFTVRNTGQLPMNFTSSRYELHYAILNADFSAYSNRIYTVGGRQGNATSKNATFVLAIAPEYIPASSLRPWGAFFNVSLSFWQYFLVQPLASGVPIEYTATLFVNVTYKGSPVIVTPNKVAIGAESGTVVTSSVAIYNLLATNTSYTVNITYPSDSVSQSYISSSISSALLLSTAYCQGTLVQSNPIDSLSDSVTLTFNLNDFPSGLHRASVAFGALGSVLTVPVEVNVRGSYANVSQTSWNTLTGTLEGPVTFGVDGYIALKDYFGNPSFTWQNSSAVKETETFNVSYYGVQTSTSGSTVASYLLDSTDDGSLYYYIFFPEVADVYILNITHVSTGVALKNSGANFTLTPIDCASNNEIHSVLLSGQCVCIAGYEETFREGVYVFCAPCPSGKFRNSTTGSSTCSTCPSGTYSVFNKDQGTAQCSTCDANEGTMVVDVSLQKRPFRVGSIVDVATDPRAFEAADNQDGCAECEKDWGLDGLDCVPCANNKKPKKVAKSMVEIGVGLMNVTWRIECVCRYGYMSTVNGTCEVAPVGSYSFGRNASELLPLRGYWHSPWNALQFTVCRDASSCPGVDLSSNGSSLATLTDDFLIAREEAFLAAYAGFGFSSVQAAACGGTCNVGFSGPLCYKCDLGYTRVGVNKCDKCIPSSAMIFVIIIGILIALLFTAYVVRAAVRNYNLNHKSATSFNEKDAAEETKTASEVVLLKIVTSHMQEMAMSVGFKLTWPVWVVSMFEVFNVISSAGQTLFSLGCLLDAPSTNGTLCGSENLNAISEQGVFDPRRANTFFVEAIFISCIPLGWAACASMFWTSYFVILKVRQKLNRGKSTFNFFLLSVIVLMFLLYPTLSRTALRFFSCSPEVISGSRFLEADFNVVCFGKLHVVWLSTLGVLMLGVFAIGFPVCMFLVLRHHHLNLSRYRDVYGFVFYGFKEKLYFWECVVMARKFLFSVCAVLLAPLGADLQAFAGLGILMIFLQLQTTYLPYTDDRMNRAEAYGLVARFTTLLLGLCLDSKNVAGDGVTFFGALIVLMNSLFLLFAALVFKNIVLLARGEKAGIFDLMGMKNPFKNKVAGEEPANPDDFGVVNPVYARERSMKPSELTNNNNP